MDNNKNPPVSDPISLLVYYTFTSAALDIAYTKYLLAYKYIILCVCVYVQVYRVVGGKEM